MESTPFAAHDIDCRYVDTTTFSSPSPLLANHWQCDLLSSGALFRSSTWDLVVTGAAESISALTEQLQASMATMVTSLSPSELPRWLISGVADYEVETTTPEDDRRLYALAAVQRLQRLLGLSQDEVAGMAGVPRPSLWNSPPGRPPPAPPPPPAPANTGGSPPAPGRPPAAWKPRSTASRSSRR